MWFKKDMLISFKLIEKFYWHNENPIIKKYTNWLIVCALLFLCLGNINYILKSYYYDKASFSELALNLSWLTSLVYLSYTLYTVISASKVGLKVWHFVEDNAHFEYPPDKLQRIVRLNRMGLIVSLAYISVMITIGFVVFELESCGKDSQENGCGIMYPNYFYINLSQRPLRELFNMIFFLTWTYILVGVILICSYLVVLLMLAQDCVDAYKSMLAEARHSQNKSLRREKLINAFKLQRFIKKAWGDVAGIFKWPLLVQYLATIITAALILITELIKFDLFSLGHLSIYFMATALFGYLGEEMKQLSKKFKDEAFYAVPWDGDVESARFLLFMNLNSENIFELPLGDFVVYSNELVVLIFKMAYSIAMMYYNNTINTK